MLRYGEKLDLDKNLWDAIVTYMNDDIREDVHFDLAPCSEEEFLDEYVKRDPEFEKMLHEEFGIEMEAWKMNRIDEIIYKETQKAAYEEQCEEVFHQEQPNEDYFEGLNDYLNGTMNI